jgi:hypothetical protein
MPWCRAARLPWRRCPQPRCVLRHRREWCRRSRSQRSLRNVCRLRAGRRRGQRRGARWTRDWDCPFAYRRCRTSGRRRWRYRTCKARLQFLAVTGSWLAGVGARNSRRMIVSMNRSWSGTCRVKLKVPAMLSGRALPGTCVRASVGRIIPVPRRVRTEVNCGAAGGRAVPETAVDCAESRGPGRWTTIRGPRIQGPPIS